MTSFVGIMFIIVIIESVLMSLAVIHYKHKSDVSSNGIVERDKELSSRTTTIKKKNLLIKEKNKKIEELENEIRKLKRECNKRL